MFEYGDRVVVTRHTRRTVAERHAVGAEGTVTTSDTSDVALVRFSHKTTGGFSTSLYSLNELELVDRAAPQPAARVPSKLDVIQTARNACLAVTDEMQRTVGDLVGRKAVAADMLLDELHTAVPQLWDPQLSAVWAAIVDAWYTAATLTST